MCDYTDGGPGNPIWVDIGRALARRYEGYLRLPLPEHLMELVRRLDPKQPAPPDPHEFVRRTDAQEI